MSDVDWSTLPTGQLGWAALTDLAASTDDRIERYFLEVKSNVDLNSKAGRAKVAKFILGASNRDPVQAARRFGGHAVMLLGVGGGIASGIPPFEAQDLARDIAKWIGADGPVWDFERIPTAGPDDVIAINVAPPTGTIWTCRADGDGLADGDIYVRADGNTRKATGDEVRAMLARIATTPPAVEVDVDILGEVVAYRVDVDHLRRWVAWRAEAFERQLHPGPPRNPASAAWLNATRAANGLNESRSKDEFLAQVASWRRTSEASPTAGIISVAARVLDGVQLRVINRTKTFLRSVRIDVRFDTSVIATAWLDPKDGKAPEPIDMFFPGAPKDWGESRQSALEYLLATPRITPASFASPIGAITIEDSNPGHLVLRLDDLRPQQEFMSDDDEVVLITFVDEMSTDSISGSWTMTAAGINDVFSGELTVPATFRDMRPAIADLLGNDLATDEAE